MASFRRFRRRYLPFLPQGKEVRLLRNKLLRKIGLTRAYEPAILTEEPALRHGNMLSLVVAQHVLEHGELTFLQIGANDGVTGDEILGLIERYPVRGILVEPQPTAFARLQELHKGRENLLLVNGAVDRESGKRLFYMPTKGDVQVASFHRQHLRQHGLIAQEISAHEVDCFTIDDVLKRGNLHSVDLLQVDAEGYDYEILKSIDFDRVLPKILRFEYRHFSKHDLDECLRMLARHGYLFLTEQLDIIAVQCKAEQAPAAAA